MQESTSQTRGVIVILSALSIFWPVYQCFAGKQAPSVFMSRDLPGAEKTEVFDCHDKIYIQATLLNLEETTYKASVVWINPKGNRQDSASYRFTGDKHNKVWFWLKLHPAFGGRFLKSINPSFGMDDFIGEWNVKLYINDELIATNMFYVTC